MLFAQFHIIAAARSTDSRFQTQIFLYSFSFVVVTVRNLVKRVCRCIVCMLLFLFDSMCTALSQLERLHTPALFAQSDAFVGVCLLLFKPIISAEKIVSTISNLSTLTFTLSAKINRRHVSKKMLFLRRSLKSSECEWFIFSICCFLPLHTTVYVHSPSRGYSRAPQISRECER